MGTIDSEAMSIAASVWAHFFLVEMRAIVLFYITVFCLIQAPSLRMYLSLRRSDFCAVPVCNQSAESQRACVAEGIRKAMWSLDLNFEDASLCTKFHGTNFGGVFNLLAIALLVSIVLFSAMQLWWLDARSYTSGSYIAFSVTFIPRQTFFQVMAFICMCYVSLMSFMAPVLILFVLPSTVIEAVDQDRLALLVSLLKNDGTTYLVALITLFTFAYGTRCPISICDSEQFKMTQFKRTWTDLFTQTNLSFIGELDQVLLKAKYGETKELADLLQDSSSLSEFLESCNPNADGSAKYASVPYESLS